MRGQVDFFIGEIKDLESKFIGGTHFSLYLENEIERLEKKVALLEEQLSGKKRKKS